MTCKIGEIAQILYIGILFWVLNIMYLMCEDVRQ